MNTGAGPTTALGLGLAFVVGQAFILVKLALRVTLLAAQTAVLAAGAEGKVALYSKGGTT